MPVSRKYKSLKKSSKTKKHSKNVKKYKSKTRKNINKLRGGAPKTACIESSDCFLNKTAEFIKKHMRKYFENKNYEIDKEEEYQIKKFLYYQLYLTDDIFKNDIEKGVRKFIPDDDEAVKKDVIAEIEHILNKYFNYKKNHQEINFVKFNHEEINRYEIESNRYENHKEIDKMIDLFIKTNKSTSKIPLNNEEGDADKIKTFLDKKFNTELGQERIDNQLKDDINYYIRKYFVVSKPLDKPLH
jgi:hypothetical protein